MIWQVQRLPPNPRLVVLSFFFLDCIWSIFGNDRNWSGQRQSGRARFRDFFHKLFSSHLWRPIIVVIIRGISKPVRKNRTTKSRWLRLLCENGREVCQNAESHLKCWRALLIFDLQSEPAKNNSFFLLLLSALFFRSLFLLFFPRGARVGLLLLLCCC